MNPMSSNPSDPFADGIDPFADGVDPFAGNSSVTTIDTPIQVDTKISSLVHDNEQPKISRLNLDTVDLNPPKSEQVITYLFPTMENDEMVYKSIDKDTPPEKLKELIDKKLLIEVSHGADGEKNYELLSGAWAIMQDQINKGKIPLSPSGKPFDIDRCKLASEKSMERIIAKVTILLVFLETIQAELERKLQSKKDAKAFNHQNHKASVEAEVIQQQVVNAEKRLSNIKEEIQKRAARIDFIIKELENIEAQITVERAKEKRNSQELDEVIAKDSKIKKFEANKLELQKQYGKFHLIREVFDNVKQGLQFEYVKVSSQPESSKHKVERMEIIDHTKDTKGTNVQTRL